MQIQIRLAHLKDIPALENLIPESARTLQANYYTPAQIEEALGTVFGVETQLIQDQTYFIAENAGQIVGCGGWSKRKTLYGGDQSKTGECDQLLDPNFDPAKIRAFFIHPAWARKGIDHATVRNSSPKRRIQNHRNHRHLSRRTVVS
jgi:hypothetical protein